MSPLTLGKVLQTQLYELEVENLLLSLVFQFFNRLEMPISGPV